MIALWPVPMSTGVPLGSDCALQPLVSVLPPVPEQWAAWPRYVVDPSLKTKLAGHWAPSVNVWRPGWTLADAAGAHGDAVGALRGSAVRAAALSAASLRALDKANPPAMDESIGQPAPERSAPCRSAGRSARRARSLCVAELSGRRFDGLLFVPNRGPRVFAAAQAAEQIRDGPAVRGGLLVEDLVPGQRRRDRRVRPRADAVGDDRGVAPGDPSGVDEEAVLALRLVGRAGELLRRPLDERAADVVAEGLDRLEVALAVERHDDVQALRAGGERERAQAELLEKRPGHAR